MRAKLFPNRKMSMKAECDIHNLNLAEHDRFTAYDDYLFRQGRHYFLYEKFGARYFHDKSGGRTRFRVWAPGAKRIWVVGEANDWKTEHGFALRPSALGVWEGAADKWRPGQAYKYLIDTGKASLWRADPFARSYESPLNGNVLICDSSYVWHDDIWMSERKKKVFSQEAINIYELHLGSWKRPEDSKRQFYSYRELSDILPAYLNDLNYTHVEFLPITEHPFYGSWGYQSIGYFAPTNRYGSPDDLKTLIDSLHEAGIGVILDWVPSHFPEDTIGLKYFDGSHQFDYEDPRLGYHEDWGSYIFDYGKGEVVSFLISSAMFWVKEFHFDAIRVDAVASMLYRDYSRTHNNWLPNCDGGRENFEAIDFLKTLNHSIHSECPGVFMIAEESTDWPHVTSRHQANSLNFDLKWDMGWMHDTLSYFYLDPIHRKFHQNNLTFRSLYETSEFFLLSLSHDEVVYGKKSLVSKMPGDTWQKFANLRLLYSYMMALPGKKLLFMGSEFAQWSEWNHDCALDWSALSKDEHRCMMGFVRELNALYIDLPALHASDYRDDGFEWIDARDVDQSIISFIRRDTAVNQIVVCLFNFTPVTRSKYRLGVPSKGPWYELLNSDGRVFGGSGASSNESVMSEAISCHHRPYSLCLDVPPLAALYLIWEGDHADKASI
jgi:1,4-alpha-glucan branching enzyme